MNIKLKKYFFKVSESLTPYWYIKQIDETSYKESVPEKMNVGVSAYYSINLETNFLEYKTLEENGELKLTDDQIRLFLSRYDRCEGSSHINYPAGKTERHDVVYKLFFT